MSVDSLAKLLEEQFRRIVDSSEIDARWKALGLQLNGEILRALKKLMEKDPFAFLPLVQYIVPKVQSIDPQLVELIILSAEKTKGDFATGYLYKAFTDLVVNNYKLIPDLIKRILDSDSRLRGGIAGIFLGNMYLNCHETDPSLLIEKLTGSDLHERICALRAVAIVGYKSDNISNKTRDLIVEMASSEQSEILMEIPGALTAVFRDGDNKITDTFTQISRSDNDIMKINVVNSLYYDKVMDVKTKLQLLLNYAETANPNIQDLLGYCLYQMRNEADINAVMSVCFKIIRNSSDRVGGSIVWVLAEYGKFRLKEMAEIVSQWVMKATDDEKLRWELFLGPHLLTELGSENRVELVQVLSEWASDPKLRLLVLSATSELLRDLNNGRESRIDEVLGNCISYLSKIAMQHGLDPEKIMRSETKKLLKCGKLLQSVQDEKPNYDFNIARKNIKNFTNLEKFVGDEWISRIEKKRERPAELVFLLSSYSDSDIDKLQTQLQQESDTNKKFQMTLQLRNNLGRRSLLKHIDDLLDRIDPGEEGISSLRDRLRGNNFATGLSELEFLSRMRRNYKVRCYPAIERILEGEKKKNRLDASVWIDGQEVMVEVITPRLMPELDYVGIASVSDRLADIIWNEYREQLGGMTVPRDIIIVVDKSRSEIQYDSAQAYMEGPISWTMIFDTKRGRAVESYVERKQEKSMGKLDSGMNVILGLLMYDRILGSDLKYHLRGRFIENPAALTTEKQAIIDKVTKTFLG